MIGIPVHRPAMRETTALGAAIAAGLAVGIWNDFADVKDVNIEGETIFKPRLRREERESRFDTWQKAVDMSKDWL